MNVGELITRLQKFDPLIEVVFNVSQGSEDGFLLTPIQKVEDIENDSEETFIMLSPSYLHGTTELSNN